MTVKEMAEALNLRVFAGEEGLGKQVGGAIPPIY